MNKQMVKSKSKRIHKKRKPIMPTKRLKLKIRKLKRNPLEERRNKKRRKRSQRQPEEIKEEIREEMIVVVKVQVKVVMPVIASD